MNEIAFRYFRTDTDVIQVMSDGFEAQDGFGQACPSGDLCERHDAKKFVAVKRFDFPVAAMTVDACLESSPRDDVQ